VVGFCRAIVELAAVFDLGTRGRATKPTIIASGDDSWHREHCVDDVNNQYLLRLHHYDPHATGDLGYHAQKGRMKRLISEISNLKTSLPPGIYLRHGNSRLDII